VPAAARGLSRSRDRDHPADVLWLLGIVAILAWAVGAISLDLGWYQHVPLVLGAVAILYAVFRGGPTEGRPPGRRTRFPVDAGG
jgi:hypothetical protein